MKSYFEHRLGQNYEEGMNKAYDKTEMWYYSKSEKCHYQWTGKYFVARPDISSVTQMVMQDKFYN